eukprot:512188_1
MTAPGLSRELVSALSSSIGEAIGEPSFTAKLDRHRGIGGDGGALVRVITDANNTSRRFFCKQGRNVEEDVTMLHGEFLGVKAMWDTGTVRVPRPICNASTASGQPFVVFEYVDMRGHDGGRALGNALARMHQKTSPNKEYGFEVENTCGPTPQPNGWMGSWSEFWDVQRLGYMLDLCAKKHGERRYPREKQVRAKVKEILVPHEKEHDVNPSLCHGDLWTGNVGTTLDGESIIFDPAAYYGDREVDIAMTMLFGRLHRDFYVGYNEVWPLPEGWKQRVVIYNAYHILNHEIIFGGGYWGQACAMLDEILGIQ